MFLLARHNLFSLAYYYHLSDAYLFCLFLGVHSIPWNTLSPWFNLYWRYHSWLWCFVFIGISSSWLSFFASVADSGFLGVLSYRIALSASVSIWWLLYWPAVKYLGDYCHFPPGLDLFSLFTTLFFPLFHP